MSAVAQLSLVLIVERRDPVSDARPRNPPPLDNVSVIGPLGTGAEALAWLERTTPTAAILDTTLGGDATDDLACALRERGVLVMDRAEIGGAMEDVVARAESKPARPSSSERTPWGPRHPNRVFSLSEGVNEF